VIRSFRHESLRRLYENPLKARLARHWSVTVSGNWRIVFRFEDGHAFDVDLVDHH
jgi:proteic killer suppression protein